MIPQAFPIRYLFNADADPSRPYGAVERSVLNHSANELAYQEISSWEEYDVTPLLSLHGLARKLGIGALWYKDEGTRLGLGSFKALGGAYGVLAVLRRESERAGLGPMSSRQLRSGEYRAVTQNITVTCASLGNHGLSVAWGASLFGCRATVFMPSGSSPDRVSAIQQWGGEVLFVDGTYEDAVASAQARATREGWFVVSDTAYEGYEAVPRDIMQGYTVLVREALAQLPAGVRPTHTFVQAGVGGFAAAVAGYLWERFGRERPRVVVVEPAAADGLMETALNGSIRPSMGDLRTTQSCLACRDPSTLAWRILQGGADAFLTLPDYGVEETVRYLSQGLDGDPCILTQPSGAAGLAGLITGSFEPTLSGPLDLGENSVVLVFGSEGPAGGHPSRC